MSFAGKRVLSFESRRATETAELIRRNEGEPILAPSLREIPLEENEEALRFGSGLLNGEFDMVILLTGVGTRQLMKVLATRWEMAQIVGALKRVTVVARGPKPVAALREIGVKPNILVPEPNTWREILSVLDNPLPPRIAIQEYGRPATELEEALRRRGAEITRVPVYSYGLPEDLEPLRDAVTQLSQQGIEVTLFTTSQQVAHLMQIARQMGLEESVACGLRKSVVGSIGPTTTEALAEFGFVPDVEPSHPKLGILVKEVADKAPEILWTKTT